jgi:hypothetical protein
MAYIGKKPEDTFKGLANKDTFTGDGSTVAFDLTFAAPAGGDFDIEVFVENVRQEPGTGKAYTLGADGNGDIKRITFSTAPESAAEIYVINPGKPYEILTVADDSVTESKIANNAVTSNKIANGSITADKIADGTIVAAEIADGTITAVKLAATLDLSGKTVTLANSEISNAELANSSITINGTSISLGGSGTIVAGTSWQTVKTSGFTAVAGEGYFCNTTSSAFTATLPASATRGNEVSFIDYAGTFDTNNLTIGRNSHNIQGVAEDLTVSTERAGFTLVYVDATQGWLLKDK